MNVAVVSFEDTCVDEGVEKLIEKYGKDINVFLPVTGKENHFAESVIDICKAYDVKVTCFITNAMGIDHLLLDSDDIVITDNPVREIIRQMTVNDAIGVVWDDSPQAHYILAAVEDFGVDVWDITEGLDPIEIDYDESTSDDLYEIMATSMLTFVHAMAEFVTSSVLDALSESIAERLQEADSRDISPFGDDEA
jgi:hypothetical protein